MKTISSCPACGSQANEVVAQLDEARRIQFLKFSQAKYGGLLSQWIESVPPVVSRCFACGHAWYRHQPEAEQLGNMYAAGRPLVAGREPSREPSAAMMSEMKRLRRLVSSASDASLLDYGSGVGRWARAGVAAGFRVTAFEPSMERGAERDAPFELVHSAAALLGRRFSVIQLEQVLEHVSDPLQTLRSLREHCAAQTLLRVTVPNLLRDPDGQRVWSTWPFDGHSPHVLAPFEHLHGFTPRSLRLLTARAGFRSIGTGRLLRHRPELPLRRWLSILQPRMGTTAQYLEIDPTDSSRH